MKTPTSDEGVTLSLDKAYLLALLSSLVLLVPLWIEMGVRLLWFRPEPLEVYGDVLANVPLWQAALVQLVLLCIHVALVLFFACSVNHGVTEGPPGESGSGEVSPTEPWVGAGHGPLGPLLVRCSLAGVSVRHPQKEMDQDAAKRPTEPAA